MKPMRNFIGLMSGTSCDGVDAALVEIEGQGLDMRVRYTHLNSAAYSDQLRLELLKFMAPARTRTETIARLNIEVGQRAAACCLELMGKVDLRSGAVTAIGSHGQTVCHMPDSEAGEGGFTLQIGEPAVIAAKTGTQVVADFRQADMAAGGQGAPLVPWTDFVLLRSPTTPRIIQNIGGIANLTYIPPGASPEDVVAFDTGPGCMVIDELVKRASRKKHRFDPAGRFASRGQADLHCVNQMLQLPFFNQGPPKSAGREQFGRNFTNGMVTMMKGLGLNKYDMLATATLMTARSMAHAYRRLRVDPRSVEVILCGGGAKNQTLVDMLRAEIPEISLRTMDDFAIPVQAKECVSMAMLAAACLDGVPANLPQVTGASRAVVLGKIVRV